MADDSQSKAGITGVAGVGAAAQFAGQENDLSQFLVRRERELIQQTAALRGALLPKEQELASVRKAMEAIGLSPSYAEQLQPFLSSENQNVNVLLSRSAKFNAEDAVYFPLTENLTIKQMIQHALADHFHDGATPSELSEYMRTVYSREVDRNSISPQLARLRDDRLVEPVGLTGKWKRTAVATLTEVIEGIDRVHEERRHRWYGGKDKKE